MSIRKNQIFKVVLMGDGGVGKTSLVLRYFDHGFSKTYKVTLGADFNAKKWGDHMIQIWDLAGQDRFAPIRKNYYKSAVGALLLFDVTNFGSFENIEKWVKEASVSSGEKFPIMVVANKVDLRKPGVDTISTEEAMRKANKLRIKFKVDIAYTETSALSGLNVDVIFEDFVNWGILGEKKEGVFFRETSFSEKEPEKDMDYQRVASPKTQEEINKRDAAYKDKKEEKKKEEKIKKKFKFDPKMI